MLQSCYDSLVADGRLSHLHAYLCAERKEDIHTRTEFYKPYMLVDVAVFTLFCVCDDASCHCSCYLSAEDVGAVVSGDEDIGMLILAACFRKPCLVEIALLMSH